VDRSVTQGCQMVYFKTKNPNLGIFWYGFSSHALFFQPV
jgi:hypothetical protein